MINLRPCYLKKEGLKYRIANNKNWMELVSNETAKIIGEINGIERIKAINNINHQNKHYQQ